MDQKQLKRNLHYFTKSDTPLYVGIGLVAVGVALFFLGYGYVSYVIASVCAPVGLLLALIGASRRVTDADIDNCVTKLTENMEVDLVENPKFAKRILKHVPMLRVQNYVYDQALAHKYAKSGSISLLLMSIQHSSIPIASTWSEYSLYMALTSAEYLQ